jgi:serine/threonine-protein kinase
MTMESATQASSASDRTTVVAPPPLLPAVGDLVDGKYRIQRHIGEGGMGTVLAARHEILQMDVALKVVSVVAPTPETLARFRREARTAAAIQSEHVGRVLDAGQLADGTPFMALELLEGKDLEQLLEERRGRVPVREAVDWILQALEGLAEAHALGIVHRDLKPSNLFLASRRDGTSIIKILDFGISKQDRPGPPLGSTASLTTTSTIVGSPMYMAPEQLRDSKRVDARADIWAVGVVLYELLVGRSPFVAENVAQLMFAILESAHSPLRRERPEVPRGLEAAVTRCLSRDPEMRFQNVADLADRLTPFGRDGARGSARRIRHLLEARLESNVRTKARRDRPRFFAVAVAALAFGAATAATLVGSSFVATRGTARFDEGGGRLHVVGQR